MKSREGAIKAASGLFDLLDPEESRKLHITLRSEAEGEYALVVRHDADFVFPAQPEEWETLRVVYEVRVPR